MLIDHAIIHVRSGKGGDGSASLRREKYIPKGGPDGGDGGRGGDVILVGDQNLDTLLPFAYRMHFRAQHGEPGGSKDCHGADGADCIVPVPLGSMIHDETTGEFLVDISTPGQQFVAARGGKGGLGNQHFKSATHQTPREFTPGGEAVERTLRLELKLIADVGLIGMPNAGKSTLLSVLTKARPKIAPYPFTTLSPQLGIAELPGERRMVIADIPGLIEGAAEGAGLGHDFLRHIERTRVLVHVLDVSPSDGSDPAANYASIRHELAEYSPELAAKPEMVALNKIDLITPEEREETLGRIAAALQNVPAERIVMVSGATKEGLRELLDVAWRLAETAKPDREASQWTAAARPGSLEGLP